MAYGFGSGVQAELGATDYSNYLRGALAGAQMQAQGGAAIGAGVQNALAGIGVGVQKFMKNKQEKIALQEATDIITPLLSNPATRSQFGIPDSATDEDVAAIVKKQVKTFGPAAALELARQAQSAAGFAAGVAGIPDMVMEQIETKEVPKFAAGSIDSFNGVSPLQSTPRQSVEELMPEGRISPFLSAPEQPVETLMPADKVASKVPVSTKQQKTIEDVPDNIKSYFAFNQQTGKLVPKRKLQLDAEETTKRFQELEQEKTTINSSLNTGQEKTVIGMTRAFQPIEGFQKLRGDTVADYDQRLNEIERQQAPLKAKLIELENARQAAVNFANKPEDQPTVEEKASKVIDRSLRFADEVNLDPVDKNQWGQLKTVIKDIPRKATDGEKIAAFVKAYSKIAPIDANVYFKMKQLFDSTPVITDLGGGNQLVSAGGQSFLINNNEDNAISVSEKKFEREELYSELVATASTIGLDALRIGHPEAFERLKQLHINLAKADPFTGKMQTLADVIASVLPPPASPTNNPASNDVMFAADNIISGT